MTIDSNAYPKLAARARLRYDGVRNCELLLLPERVVKLNPTAAVILRFCDGKRTIVEITRLLEEQYGQKDLAADIEEFLHDVVKRGWVRMEDGSR